jgi:hypothetical protein
VQECSARIVPIRLGCLSGASSPCKIAQFANQRVLGCLSRSEHSNRDERFICGTLPNRLEGSIERGSPWIVETIAQNVIDCFALRRLPVEEVSVQRPQVHVVRWLCLLAVMLLVGASGPKSDLLERAAQSSGEPWRYHVVSRMTGTQTQIDEQGDVVVTQRCRGVVCRGTITNAARGRVSFFSYNGTPIPQTAPLDPLQITLRAIVSYAFTSPEFSADGGTVVARPQRRLGNSSVAPFAVTAPHGAELDALLDPATGLLVAVAQGHDAIYRYGDLRRVGALTLPFEVLRADGTSQVYDDRQVVGAPLVPPSGPEVAFTRSLQPLSLIPGTLPYFPCRVEQVAARCVLDTGASGLAISLDLADRLGKSLVGELDLEGLGTVATGVVRAESLQLGSMLVGPALYAVLPDAGGFGADVLVGTDVLAHAVVRVDPQRRTIEFAPTGSPISGTRVPLAFDGFVPSVPIRLGRLDESLILDTGDSGSIDLSGEFAQGHPGLVETNRNRNVIGTQSIGRIGQVEFAGFPLTDVLAGVYKGATAPPSRVGNGFLSRFAFDLDYTELRMSVHTLR